MSRSHHHRPVGWALAVVLASGACTERMARETEEPGRLRNVLFVSIDTLRADHVGAYGANPQARTPNIDRIAREGVLFETVQTVAPTTLPAHASLFTGLTPPRHGLRDNVGFYLASEVPTLASRLKAAGYRTAAFVGAFVLDSRFGLDQGFDTYFDEFEDVDAAIASGLVSHRRGRDVLDSALSWLGSLPSGDDAQPFFAFVHFYDPHAPYEAPGGSDGPPDVRYREEITYVDGLVGELLDWLEETGEASRTVVVLVSDHGESLGEHGEDTHGFFVYQSTLAVPWILRVPGGPQGERVEGLASVIDVTPTLLDLLGLEEIEHTDGRSLKAALEGSPIPSRAVYAESFVSRVHFGWSELRSVRDERYKLIVAPRSELYDLEEDPEESTNLVTEASELDRVRSLREVVEAQARAESASPLALDPESLERLRSLGYAGSPKVSDAKTATDPKDRIAIYELLIDTELSDASPAEARRYADALRKLEEAIRVDPSIPRAYVLYGELLLKGGDNGRAREAFEHLLRLDEQSFEGHYGLGMVLARSGRLDAASEEFARARAIEPRNTKSYFQLAELSMARGDAASAEHWLREAIALNSDRVLVARLAQVLFEAGKRDEATSLLLDLAARHPDDPREAYNLAQMLLVGGSPERALVEFRRATELAEDPDSFQGLGNALASLGRLDEAASAYARAVALSPCFTQALSNLGSAYFQLKRLDEAEAPLEKAIACDPSYPGAYQNLAAVRMEKGDLEGAIAVLRAGVAVSPEATALTTALDELERYRSSR